MADLNEYNVVNNKMDQLDILTLSEPAETPVFTSAKKYRKVRSPLFEYYTDSLEDITLDTFADGKDVESFENKAKNRAKIEQRTQIQNRTWKVSRGQQEDTDTAGVPDEVARAKMICALELKRDMEASICSDQDIGFGEDTGGRFRALGKFLDDANTNIPTNARMKAAAKANTADLTETTFRQVLQAVYEASGNANGKFRLFAGPSLQNAITNFSRMSSTEGNILSAQLVAGAKEITCSVKIYNSDFGIVAIIPTLFNGRANGLGVDETVQNRGYLLDMDKFDISLCKNLWAEEYEDRGGGRRGAVWSKYTILHRNPKGGAKFV